MDKKGAFHLSVVYTSYRSVPKKLVHHLYLRKLREILVLTVFDNSDPKAEFFIRLKVLIP